MDDRVGFNYRCRTFISVCNQSISKRCVHDEALYKFTFTFKTLPLNQANSAVHTSGVVKWEPTSAGKERVGMVHSVRINAGCACRGVFTTTRYTDPSLPLPLNQKPDGQVCHIFFIASRDCGRMTRVWGWGGANRGEPGAETRWG